MARPLGASVLAAILSVLAAAGFGNAYVMSTQSSYGTPLLALVALLYGVTAIAAAVGLWRRKRWAYPAFLVWASIVFVGAVIAQFSIAELPLIKLLLFFLIAGTVLFFLARYVHKVSTAAL